MLKRIFALTALALVAAACSVVGTGGIVPVATTGDTARDPSAAQQFVPDIPGYISTDASNITAAISAVGGGASLITGNPVTAALIAQIDGMINCYRATGSVAAKVYVQADIGQVAQGQIPIVGAMAVLNQDRLVNNFLACALGAGPQGFSAQAAQQQPCSNAGSFVFNGETLHYLYAATDISLCQQLQARIPVSER